MIGNDIVDLAQAKRESNWQRRGYLDKIFTPHEQQLIQTATDPDQLVWLLWSMKESVYKLAVRRTRNRVFAPGRITCELAGPVSKCSTGFVYYEEWYHTISTLTSTYVSTIAFSADDIPVYNQVILPFETTSVLAQQDMIRKKIRQHAARLFNLDDQEIHLRKDSIGAPVIMVRGAGERPVSLSHHGHFGAFVISLTNR
ncbi:4'-phosphopantetheinyl transferase family protein [Spirosoma aerophilum]